jgi:hypothetical protein
MAVLWRTSTGSTVDLPGCHRPVSGSLMSLSSQRERERERERSGAGIVRNKRIRSNGTVTEIFGIVYQTCSEALIKREQVEHRSCQGGP